MNNDNKKADNSIPSQHPAKASMEVEENSTTSMTILTTRMTTRRRLTNPNHLSIQRKHGG
jgi:hypothetical protein